VKEQAELETLVHTVERGPPVGVMLMDGAVPGFAYLVEGVGHRAGDDAVVGQRVDPGLQPVLTQGRVVKP
jgi:hypothetical protein